MIGDRVPSGVRGMDDLIEGGFPPHSVNLVTGPAGSGKSLFALHYFWNGYTEYGDPGAFLVLEESRPNIERVMAGFGMDLAPHEDEGKLHLIDLGRIRRGSGRTVVGFHELRDFLRAFIPTSGITRLVIDSLPVVGLYYRDSEEFREEMFTFARFLRDQGVTPLLISESIEDGGLTRYGIEQFVADSFIVLGLDEVKGELRRTVTVRKMRFTKHDTAKHPLFITARGMEISAEERVVA